VTIDSSLDIVIPVLNEEHDLVPTVEKLLSFLPDNLQEYDWRIVIADNGSTDATLTDQYLRVTWWVLRISKRRSSL
jgi:glycosyltransferase involved in cell wall biosynthesis